MGVDEERLGESILSVHEVACHRGGSSADGPEEGGHKITRDYLSFAEIAICVDGRIGELRCWPAAASSARSITLRTRGSWVQVLPGAPIFKELRAASEAVSRSAGPFVHWADSRAFATRNTVRVS